MGEIEQLVRRAKKRDPDAFTELMQLHEKDMYRTASAILPQDADIADAIQETILTVWEKIDTLQKNRYFKTWMIRILINKCKDILRSGKDDLCGRTAGTGSEGYSGGRGKFGMEGSPVGTG